MILIVNGGTSSLKVKVYNEQGEVIAKIIALNEKIDDINDTPKTEITYRAIKGNEKIFVKIINDDTDYKRVLGTMIMLLIDWETGILKSLNEIKYVGHRVVKGGLDFSPVIYSPEVVEIIEANYFLAPLHNHINLEGYRIIKRMIPNAPQVAVFDSEYFSKMPEIKKIYGLPYEYYEKYHIQKFGYQGTAHEYVAEVVEKMFGENKKLTSCHFGNGCSMTAHVGKTAIDTTMGFSTLTGLVMGTRPGNLDPEILFYLMRTAEVGVGQLEDMLYKKSGLLGLSGLSHDMRIIEKYMKENHSGATLAHQVFIKRAIYYIGRCAAALNGLEVLTFSGGIGEASYLVRDRICKTLGWIGVEIDKKLNRDYHYSQGNVVISTQNSKVKVVIIPADEEYIIYKKVKKVCNIN
ncbi:MAG: acetate/propionate family kinase [Fusobacteria bacterium]|nr:acetate/propionate family kinase [Fusobacteriota bacterium]